MKRDLQLETKDKSKEGKDSKGDGSDDQADQGNLSISPTRLALKGRTYPMSNVGHGFTTSSHATPTSLQEEGNDIRPNE